MRQIAPAKSQPTLVVGRWRGRYLRFAGQQFVLLAAPARSGKGVGIVIPNLLSYSDSVVVLENGCLCCTVRSDLVATLNSLYHARQAGEIPAFDNVVIEKAKVVELAL